MQKTKMARTFPRAGFPGPKAQRSRGRPHNMLALGRHIFLVPGLHNIKHARVMEHAAISGRYITSDDNDDHKLRQSHRGKEGQLPPP